MTARRDAATRRVGVWRRMPDGVEEGESAQDHGGRERGRRAVLSHPAGSGPRPARRPAIPCTRQRLPTEPGKDNCRRSSAACCPRAQIELCIDQCFFEYHARALSLVQRCLRSAAYGATMTPRRWRSSRSSRIADQSAALHDRRRMSRRSRIRALFRAICVRMGIPSARRIAQVRSLRRLLAATIALPHGLACRAREGPGPLPDR